LELILFLIKSMKTLVKGLLNLLNLQGYSTSSGFILVTQPIGYEIIA